MAEKPGQTRSSILRVDMRKQKTETFIDTRVGGGYRKIFPGVKERLTFVAHQLDIAVDDYKTAYSLTVASAPYLIFELQPTAIAKSHSALHVLEECGLEVVATRALEEKIVHGVEGAFKRLEGDLVSAAEHAPTDEDLRMLDEEDKVSRKKRRKQTGDAHQGKDRKPQKSVRRNLPGGKFVWNEIAQFSTFRNVGFIRPEEKISVPANFEAAPVFVSTFPFCVRADDIGVWITRMDCLIKEYKSGIRVLRANKTVMTEIQKHANGLGDSWKLDVNRAYETHQSSIVFLIENASAKMMHELVGCEFVRSVELGGIRSDVLNLAPKMSIPIPPASIRTLPEAGVVDTGIAAPSKLDPYISFRGGEKDIRNQKVFHATDVAYLLVHDGRATPWNPAVAGLPCAIRDVARIDGGMIDGNQLKRAIWEASRDGSGEEGTVNFSANVPGGGRTNPPPEVSVLGEMLDHMSLEEEKLMIVCSAGNSGSVGMDSPADGVHVISVGAFTRTPQGKFVRSDYSCHGGGIAHNAKPTFVVPVHDPTNKDRVWDTLVPSGKHGTSFAAPVATRVHAGLVHRGYNRDEALALMVHHAKHPGRDVYYQPSSKEIEEFGFGVVPSISECDPPDGSRITLIYDVSVVRGKFYELKLPIPQEISKYSAFARLTAYTRSPCSREMGEEYVSAEVPTHLRMYKKKVTQGGVPYVDLPPEPIDWKARYEEHRIKYGWKWGTLRRYSKSIRFEKYDAFALRLGPVIRRKWMPEEILGQHIKVQCVLSFYPLEGEAPPFFDFFRQALADAQVEIEVPLEARIELEGEI